MSLRLEDDHMCYVCGKANEKGLRLDFIHSQKGRLEATVVFSEHHQGFKGIVHGGMMAMVLDEMMVNLAWKEGIPAVTAELHVRLKKAAKTGEKIHLEGHMKGGGEGKKRAFQASSLAKNERGEVLASATATCIRIQPLKTNPLEERVKSS